jgi:hypothetical protein
MLQTIVDYGATFLAWTVTVFRLGAVLRERGRNQRMLKAWLFTLFFSLFGTFEIDALYVRFDRLVGVNNPSWLLSSLFLVLSIYFLCALCCSRRPRWMRDYLIVTASLLVVVFPFGPGGEPESADQFIPSNVPGLLFVALSYVFAIVVMGLVPVRAFFQAHRDETELVIRLRTSAILMAVILGVAFFVVKLAICCLGFFVPALPVAPLRRAASLASVPVLVACCLWPLGFVPHRFYATLARLLGFLQKVLVLRELSAVKARLDRLCPPVLPGRVTWSDQLRYMDLFVYRSVIGILDGRKMLAARLAPPGGEAGGPSGNTAVHLRDTQGSLGSVRWSRRDVEEAARLHEALQGIPESLAFEQLVDACRDAARRLRKSV